MNKKILFFVLAPFWAAYRDDCLLVLLGIVAFVSFAGMMAVTKNTLAEAFGAAICTWVAGNAIELFCQWRENRKDKGFHLVP